MNEIGLTKDMILMILPLVLLQYGLFAYCAVKIFREGVQNLNKWGWFFICLFVNILGPIIFLIVGRKRDN